jgi:predicted nucleotidyltransferase
MVIHRVLDEVLRSWSHVAVLRTLLDTNIGRTGSEIARIAGMHPLSALRALSSLEVLGIVFRQRGGRDHIFTLNRNHVLVQQALLPLYSGEKNFPEAIASALTKLLRRRVISAVIFGSVARQEETPQSDLDLCCIVHDRRRQDSVRELLQSRASAIYRDFGIKIAPLILTVAEIKAKSKTSVVRDIVRSGKLLTGRRFEELIRG